MKKALIPVSLGAAVAIAVWCLLPRDRVFAGEDAELLSVVNAGTKNACSSIRSGRGKVTVHKWRWLGDRVSETETEYTVVFSGEKYRMSREVRYLENTPEKEGGGKRLIPPGTVLRDEVGFDGTKVAVYAPDRKFAAIAEPSSPQVSAAHSDYLLNVRVLQHTFVDTERMDAPQIVGREVLEGSECVVLESESPIARRDGSSGSTLVKLWADPQRGFTVPRARVYVGGGSLTERILSDEINSEIRSYSDGVWGPSKRTVEAYRRAEGTFKLQSRTVTTYDPAFELNVPVTAEELSVRLPSGTRVHDEIADAKYVVP